ncbi:unnamed protein product, partial [Prorocentrum cordatum]
RRRSEEEEEAPSRPRGGGAPGSAARTTEEQQRGSSRARGERAEERSIEVDSPWTPRSGSVCSACLSAAPSACASPFSPSRARAPGAAPEPAESLAAAVLAATHMRCGEGALRWLAEPLRGALDAVAEAEARCSRSSGYARLLAEPQRGLFLGGRLMDEARGASRSLEPNPVRQLEHDLDDLLDSARQAQEQLQALVAPSQGAWPPGQVAEKPEAFPMALFAYNPGVKPRAAAEVKALASYGPAEGGRRHRHLLDLARLSLVFGSCEMLQLGLDSVLRQFKVLGVRNLFRCPSRSLVWTRRVEARPATVQEGTKTLFPNPPWLGIRFE